MHKNHVFLTYKDLNMRYFRLAFPLLFFTFFLLFASGCAKRCELPEDESIGDVVPGSVVKELNVGYNQIIRSVPDPANNPYQVSFNDGYSYNGVDFDSYSLLIQPANVSCHSQVVKEVEIDKAKSRVTYTLTINQCPDCDDLYSASNFVLVPKIPNNYSVFFRKNVVEKE